MLKKPRFLLFLTAGFFVTLIVLAALSVHFNVAPDEAAFDVATESRARDDATVDAQLSELEQQRLINADVSRNLSELVTQSRYFSVYVEDQLMIFADTLVGGQAEAQAQCDSVAFDVVFATKLVTCVLDGEVIYSDVFVPG